MTKYIKVRPHVAQRIGVEPDRRRFADGDYVLWDKDLSAVDNGWPFHIEDTVARIGGVLMDPYQCRAEQEKTDPEECIPCPLPTDPEWMDPEQEAALGEAVEEIEEELEEELEEDIAEDPGEEPAEDPSGEEGGER